MSWPPRGLSQDSEFSVQKAELLISKGVLFFEGLCLQANHTLTRRPRFYATARCADAGKPLEDQRGSTLADTSHVLGNQPLEQPSMGQCFGALPGTISLNRYINAISGPRHPEPLPRYGIQPRATDNLLVLQRLHYLMTNGWDKDIEIAEEFLCTHLVYDPAWQKGAPLQLQRQIMVLIAALSNPIWTDFRDSASQILANYYDTEDVDVEKHFWQQLLLSVELDLRLQAAGDQEGSMASQVPEKVAWDLALSKVWRSKMALVPIDEGSRPATCFHVTALTTDTQKERLLRFARNVKWVNIHDVEYMLEEDSEGGIPLEFLNAHTSSWITGTILPGPSACWLAMRCLIDCDPTIINTPHGFENMDSAFGFQYCGSTYFYFENIVGKVLGASRGVNQDYGWVGPCIPSSDLFNLQTVLIHTEDVPVKPSKSRIQKIAARSAPLGPPAQTYPVRDYILPLPPDTTNIVDSIRIQKLAFNMHSLPISPDDPTTYSAAIVFAVENEIIPIRLRYDVSFIYAPPCRGQHPLFWDYAYQTIQVDELLLDLRCWNGVFVDAKTRSENSDSCASSFPSTSSAEADVSEKIKKKKKKTSGPESILVVEAYGVEDNEVLARAWASHIGFSAVVANGRETCVACAIRMAYAASVHMVILGEGSREAE